MDFRKLLLAAVLLAALGGAAYWAEKHPKQDEKKDGLAAAPKVLDVPADQVQQVEVKRSAATPVTVVREKDQWKITAPEPLRADQDAAQSLASNAAQVSADRVVEEKAGDLAAYGLASPPMEVVVRRKDGKTDTLLIGDGTPTGSAFYAKLANDPRVFTISSGVKTGLDKTGKDLQDKRLLTFDSEKLSRVELAAKKQTLEFGKNNQNEWQILKPRPLRADGSQVEEVIRKLREAKMDLAGDADEQKKAAGAFGSGTAIATAKVTDASGTQQLEVRKSKDDYYAKSSVVPGAFKVNKELGEGLDKTLDDFRNKKLWDFGFSDPNKVEVRDGAKTYIFQKSGDKWTAGGKQMDAISVQNLIDKLRDLAATKFVEQGFGTPELEVSVASNDGKRVEKVQFAKQNDHWIAKRENEPSLYELDGKAVSDLQRAAADVKEPPPASKGK